MAFNVIEIRRENLENLFGTINFDQKKFVKLLIVTINMFVPVYTKLNADFLM